MKQHHKVGNRPGRPAYRTPASFRVNKAMKTRIVKIKNDQPAGGTTGSSDPSNSAGRQAADRDDRRNFL
ncbi:hypothetical protein A2V95_01200 [Candidatus Kuenenbacteria bacterium RBG_16_41_7]|uniref:Uncharacterized protein n=1 Tax=Candidatus Kuenenbacteria bacterium RBG_16_41_7 TaxID=1798560 RepID=A0A1F6GCQ4_9BACT|nr:MAG: hypothetical protein A2V95_01200 [Candidatus Kuenenbacteria bacterium RBG_16_41_7]